ncbi:MAG TPA: pitrilysin family protein [Polyangiaceae bacterium]|nr:pitrilysin family protein [Polyangiaceae bacterium]
MSEEISTIDAMLQRVNAARLKGDGALLGGIVSYLEAIPFSKTLQVHRYRLANGLSLLLLEDHSAPVVAYHTWYRVGSRHEREGKTGLSHLFEHLMFNETENLPAGEFDRKLEEAGAESNASTWLDWTHYNIAIPKDQLPLVIGLEAERMAHLVLKDPQVTSEKEVVANERRYRVDDDVEGAISELLWATCFREHAYRWPTIGWMQDIEGFTTEDCRQFYKTYYSPNNATVVVAGSFDTETLLSSVAAAYGSMAPALLPVEEVKPEPPQTEERRVEVQKPTVSEKLAIGYHCPALGDFDHAPLTLLCEILFGGRASRLVKKMVRELELASEVRMFVGPFHDPGMMELFASARDSHTAEEMLAVIDQEFERVRNEAIAVSEIERALARFELGMLAGLETADSKASTIGFYETVLGDPGASFARLAALRRQNQSDLLRVARRYLTPQTRSVIIVHPTGSVLEAAQ